MARDLSSTTAVEKYSYKKSLTQRRKQLQMQKSGENEGEDDKTVDGLSELYGLKPKDREALQAREDAGDEITADDAAEIVYKGPERRKKPKKAKRLTKKQEADFND